MHGVREDLLELQAEAIGIPLQKHLLPDQPSMKDYEEHMMKTLGELQQQKYTHSVFGDIFLEDLKIYRENQLAKVGMGGVFPLWKRNSTQLINEFLDLGFKTIVVCLNEKFLDKSFCGRIIDKDFIKDLPQNVDVCGENGEFHTFVFDGPIFKNSIGFKKGETVYRKYEAPKTAADACFTKNDATQYGFYFCDLLPA